MHAKPFQICHMLPNVTFSCFPTSPPAPFNSATSQGQGDQLQTLINETSSKTEDRQEGGCFHDFPGMEGTYCVIHSPCKTPKGTQN